VYSSVTEIIQLPVYEEDVGSKGECCLLPLRDARVEGNIEGGLIYWNGLFQ
jgi:hypothetical protein